jgi:4-amino-4-deoxy-L-arabinose transferase-like glycosyltransferase
VRLLVALQLVLIAATGAATVARFPVFALVDERAHYAYVQEVAEDRRLPWLGRSRVSAEVQALDEGVYPAPPRTRPSGLAAFSYEAFQPPLFYALAAPAYGLAGADHARKLRVLRALGLVALLAAAALLWSLARRVAGPERALGVYAVALTVLAWPGVVVRTVTVSNATLELVLGVAAAIALWEARGRRGGRWLAAAGALIGLGLLTRTTFVVFVPVLLWVARRHPWRAAVVALALPAVLLAPWVASNFDRYGAPTAGAIVRDMQEPFLNPTGRDYGVGDVRERAGRLLNGVVAEEWWSRFLPAANRRLRDLSMVVLFLVPLGLAVRRGRRLEPEIWLLAAPLAFALALMAAGMLIGNWDFFYPRYAYAALPGFAVLAALALPARARPYAAGGSTLVLALLWAHLATVTPFTA